MSAYVPAATPSDYSFQNGSNSIYQLDHLISSSHGFNCLVSILFYSASSRRLDTIWSACSLCQRPSAVYNPS